MLKNDGYLSPLLKNKWGLILKPSISLQYDMGNRIISRQYKSSNLFFYYYLIWNVIETD